MSYCNLLNKMNNSLVNSFLSLKMEVYWKAGSYTMPVEARSILNFSFNHLQQLLYPGQGHSRARAYGWNTGCKADGTP